MFLAYNGLGGSSDFHDQCRHYYNYAIDSVLVAKDSCCIVEPICQLSWVSGFSDLRHLLLCSIRLTTFDIVKRLIAASEKEFQKIVDENRQKEKAV